jgi:hypothetical protein
MTPLPPDSQWAHALRAAQDHEQSQAPAARMNGNGARVNWPLSPRDDAFSGLAGAVARALDPYTEADAAAVLLTYLAAFGNAAGGSAHMLVSTTRHAARFFLALVGPTGGGRKGTAGDVASSVYERADPEWAKHRMMRGAVSGEGVIHQVRDARAEQIAVYDGKGPDKRFVEWREEPVDPGVPDKRLLYVCEEFAAPLSASRRDGNTLSAILRLSWDGKTLETGAKTSPSRATGAHVSFIAHVTVEELRELMTNREVFNGFANRFLWACVRRSKHLPEPEPVPEALLDNLAGQTRDALEFARRVGRLERDRGARAEWAQAYAHLGREREGLFGKACDRAQAQVLRLQLVFALLDCSPVVRAEHVRAALAVWDFCERSAAYVFRDGATSRREQMARRIVGYLESEGAPGLDRTEIRSRLGGRVPAEQIDDALDLLKSTGHACCVTQETGGRPAKRWFAVSTRGVSSTSDPLLHADAGGSGPIADDAQQGGGR